MKTLSSNCFLSLLCVLLSVIYIISHQPFLSIIPYFDGYNKIIPALFRTGMIRYRWNNNATYFTWSMMALKASGLFMARSARTLRLISIPDLVSLSMNWL